jgi:hypothetical protein
MSAVFFRSFAVACGVLFLMTASTSFAADNDTTTKSNVQAPESQTKEQANGKADEAKREPAERPKKAPVYIPEEVTRAKEPRQ